MTDNTDQEKRPLSLGRTGGRLELRKPSDAGQVRQSFPHGRSKTVQVEVRKKRTLVPGPGEKAEPATTTEAPAAGAAPAAPAAAPAARRPVVLPRLA